jgi:hypothetical protein
MAPHGISLPESGCVMAGRGPAPKGKRARDRDTPVRDMVKSDGKLGGWPLPDDALKEGESWHPRTVKWWDAWRESPQAQRMVTEVDWETLLECALMHHEMWTKRHFLLANEVRLRTAKFGATPEDRARLKLEIEVPEHYEAGHTPGDGENVTPIDRRDRWSGGSSPTSSTGTADMAPGF